MTITSIATCSSSNLILVEATRFRSTRTSRLDSSTIRCSSLRKVPKLEPFSRNKFDRVSKDPPLITKSENDLADYCSILEGDDSYSCWRAYFELKDLQREAPKKDVEKMILQAGGVRSLIGCLHGIASIFRDEKKNEFSLTKSLEIEKERKRNFHIPDGLPKSKEELEEEERGKMPDSPFTRLLRAKGKSPAWYSPSLYQLTD